MPLKDLNGNTVIASGRDVGNYGAGFVAGRKGLSWSTTRLGFDGFQTISDGSWKKGNWSKESMSSQSAQKIGFSAGINQRGSDNSGLRSGLWKISGFDTYIPR